MKLSALIMVSTQFSYWFQSPDTYINMRSIALICKKCVTSLSRIGKSYDISIHFLLPFGGIGLIYIYIASATRLPKLSLALPLNAALSLWLSAFQDRTEEHSPLNSGSQCSAVIYELLATVISNG